MHNFKLAAKKVLLFILSFILICSPSFYFYFKFGSDNNNSKPELDAEKGKIDFLFCGASQFVWGFVPEVMDEFGNVNSFNISSGLLSMKGRYTIFKEVLEDNPIKTLIVDLSYNSLERSDQTETIEGTLLLCEHLSLKGRIKYTIQNVPLSEGSTYIGYILRTGGYKMLDKLRSIEEPKHEYAGKGYWGGHEPTSFADTKVYWSPSGYPAKETYITEDETMYYLEQIINCCKKNNINVYFVTTPYPTNVISWKDRNGVLEIHKSIAQKYNYPLYDLNLYKERDSLFNDQYSYFDAEHLSTPGAVVCTQLLAQLIAENDPGVSYSDKFFNDYNEFIDNYFSQKIS